MPKKEYTCIACPKGCKIELEYEGEEIKDISGYSCVKGKEYVKDEFHDPRRILTTTVKINQAKYPRLPVRTETGVPKDELDCCLEELKKIQLEAPVKIGEVVIGDVCGTGISVTASRSLEKLNGDKR